MTNKKKGKELNKKEKEKRKYSLNYKNLNRL